MKLKGNKTGICTKLEQINTVNAELLILCAKNLVRWMGGWVGGWM